MELRQFRYFIAVAKSEHFRRAAKALSIAQPALSRQVKALEDELGVSLFERLPRGVRLTEPGRIFLHEAIRIIDEVEAASERVKRSARGQVGTLRIAFSEAMSGHDVLTRAIRSFRTTFADVEIILTPMTSLLQVEALRTGRIDAGFQYSRSSGRDGFEHCEMARENLLLALPQTHPLAGRKAICLTDLKEEPLICVAQHINPNFYGAVMAMFISDKIVPRIVQEASSIVVLSLVAIGMGLGIVSSALRWHVPQGVVLRNVKDLSLPTAVDLVWRQGDTSPALSQFIKNAIRVARSGTPAPSRKNPLAAQRARRAPI